MRDRRLGRFEVTERFLVGAENGEGANLFRDMVIVDAQRQFHKATTEFVAWHPSFERVPEGTIIPRYEATFSAGSSTPTWMLVHQDNRMTE